MKKRNFLIGSLGLAAVGGVYYSFRFEPSWIEYVQMPLPIRNLPAQLVGQTLVQLSDLHIGNQFNPAFILKAFEQIKSLNPAYVVYTGDFITYHGSEQLSQLKQVMQLAPTGSLGSFAVLGNHDYGTHWRMPSVANSVADILKTSGIQPLRNEVVDAAGLNVCGLDDYWGTNFRPEPVLASLNPNNANLVLSHNPDTVDLDIWHNYKGWILSGHTHGGQIKPPFLPPIFIPVQNKLYTAGAFDLGDDKHLYINRALGNLKSVRFNVRPEVTIFTLNRA